jgi:hypothetical protein
MSAVINNKIDDFDWVITQNNIDRLPRMILAL